MRVAQAVVLVMAVASPGYTSSDKLLELEVRLDSETYIMGDSLDVEIEVVNRGETHVAFFAIFDWGHLGTLHYDVISKDDGLVSELMWVDDFRAIEEPAPPRILGPGESVVTTTTLKVGSILREPGAYVLDVTYLAPVSTIREADVGHPILTRDHGALVGSVEFEVE